MKKRILMSVLGVLTGAVSVAIFRIAAFGVDPFQSFMNGVDKLVPLQFGTLYVIRLQRRQQREHSLRILHFRRIVLRWIC